MSVIEKDTTGKQVRIGQHNYGRDRSVVINRQGTTLGEGINSGKTLKSAFKRGHDKDNTDGAASSSNQEINSLTGHAKNAVRKELSSVTEHFQIHEAKFYQADLLKKMTISLVKQNNQRFKENSKLSGDALFMSLLSNDAGAQLDMLTNYLNTFKPAVEKEIKQ